MTTYITRLAESGSGIAVAVKDLLDLTGTVTTAGCRALADLAQPATRDAACLAELRRREAQGEAWIVGKTNLHELAYGTTGINPWWGTPVNPRYPHLIPGGSSSGSAVAVASGDAVVGIGTDTGGSVRIPAACCAIAGLKTTWGRIPTSGVWPLAPSLDTVGPLAADVAGLVLGMQLLDGASFATADASGLGIGRARLQGVEVHPAIDDVVDAALARCGLPVTDVPVSGWDEAWSAADTILSAEAWRVDSRLLAEHPEGIGEATAQRIAAGEAVTVEAEAAARRAQLRWQKDLEALMAETPVLALPVLADLPPALDAGPVRLNRLTIPVNLAGFPALSLPVGEVDGAPVALQLVAPAYGEEMLLSVGLLIEQSMASIG